MVIPLRVACIKQGHSRRLLGMSPGFSLAPLGCMLILACGLFSTDVVFLRGCRAGVCEQGGDNRYETAVITAYNNGLSSLSPDSILRRHQMVIVESQLDRI